MKKNIFIIASVLAVLAVFYAGYRYGINNANLYAIEYMQQMANQQIASRAISQINDLGKMQSLAKDERQLRCHLKDNISRLIGDLEKCEADSSCRSKIQGGYYERAKEVTKIFAAEQC